MPFKSEAQRRFLWAKHPQLAQEWSDKYGTPRNLPEHVRNEKRTAKRNRKHWNK